MAPSIQQLEEELPSLTVNPSKLIGIQKEAPKEVKEEESPKEETPYVKRQIDVEGGTTTATVHSPLYP